jgi:tetratricopeptide (TPR) repeat protein
MKFTCYLFLLSAWTLFAQNDPTTVPDPTFKAYEAAGLKEKFEMNKRYAANEVLPVLSGYQTIVDDKFAGVKNFGKLVAQTDFNLPQDVTVLTSNNPDYWRATMEMALRNELIPTTKIFMLVSQGEFDYAVKYLEIVGMISKEDNYAHAHLLNLEKRLKLFNDQLNAEIQKGIAAHDQADFEKAIAIYQQILKDYPNSAWANFELFYSQFALNHKSGHKERNTFESWDAARQTIFAHNPLFNVQMSAKDGDDAYAIYRRNSIGSLFKDSKNKLPDFFKYADIAMDLQAYDFAAQLFWYTASYTKIETSLNKYLYCLEKLGVNNLKDQFKGDFEAEFAKIDKQREKEKTSSAAYQSHKD